MANNPICGFDFTAPASKNSVFTIKTALNNFCKSWCFQLEKGKEGGYEHFQGRFSLKTKSRKANHLNIVNAHFSPTTTLNTNNFDYVMKEDTRLEGPWTDKDEPAYVPIHYRGKMDTLRPFQKKIIEMIQDFLKKYDDRGINLIYCPNGNKGKSTIAHLCRLFMRGIVLPPLNDADRLIYTACNICQSKNIRKSVPIFIDLPRAMNKERLYGLYSAVEVIKQGYLCDTRNKYNDWDIDTPIIFVFTNIEPELNSLSKDRWNIWTINDQEELVEYKALHCNNIYSTTPEHLEHFEFHSYDNGQL